MISAVRRQASLLTHHIFELPILVLMPHSRCNCRCVMCDIWKANHEKREITENEILPHLDAFKKLGVRHVALSGGEALLHPNLWKLCAALRTISVHISLLSTGLTLATHAAAVAEHCNEVIVSLDGPPEVHNRIRNIPTAFDKLREGVAALKKMRPEMRVTGRSVLQRMNFRVFVDTIETSRSLGLDQISFLAADVSSTAFNRPDPWDADKTVVISLSAEEATELEEILRNSFESHRATYESGFIAETPEKMLTIVQHYQALLGLTSFPSKRCNAPWVSAVIESNGDVMPCFFHPPYGNIHQSDFRAIVNSTVAKNFRRALDVRTNEVCQRCVCSLQLSPIRSV
ncbi:MAG TPA: radical SAM protein [Cyclobacteriaceae bacterium]|nr:radical SAM protein [Cyclobacteriaceae bacterium]